MSIWHGVAIVAARSTLPGETSRRDRSAAGQMDRHFINRLWSSPLALIARKFLLILWGAILLTACQGETASVRYRVIAGIEVDGKPIEASTVMEVRYSRVTQSLTGAGGATRLYGETLSFDIPGKGAFYILPVEHEKGGTLAPIWEKAILLTLGIKSSIGMLQDADFDRMKAATGRMPFRMFGGNRYPAFIAFRDEKNPKTIYEIQPRDLAKVFPGVRFTGLDIEITDESVTSKIRDRLPWLNTPVGKQVFERDPPGHQRSDQDSPIGFLITKAHFFGDGSR
ncbi:hypothetical protein [Rhizobium leguminosarum]|uniref:hypothetical protein n=1 Tax=Rhizobium leguminosarum TaxID=384 RepID=UPI00197E610B|nr:hypothetical protein [Rhizobium leguminosarum]